jgi:hypothetical protein
MEFGGMSRALPNLRYDAAVRRKVASVNTLANPKRKTQHDHAGRRKEAENQPDTKSQESWRRCRNDLPREEEQKQCPAAPEYPGADHSPKTRVGTDWHMSEDSYNHTQAIHGGRCK